MALFLSKNKKGFKDMMIMAIIFYYLVIPVVLIILTSLKIYNMYLDRCRESLRKKREMDKEIREMAQKIKDKISKK